MCRKSRFHLFVLCIAVMLSLGFVSNVFAVTVGYYDMSAGAGSATQVASITAAGFTPVLLGDLTAADIADVDIIYVQNPSNSIYGAEYLSRLADIQNAVNAGKKLIIHDRYVTPAATILPGGETFDIVRDTDIDDAAINIRDNTTLVTNGPGGILTDTSLDGGNSSSHGYAVAGSLPVSATLILTRTDPDHIVTFSYPVGLGCVVYSTIPLDYYLGGSGNNPPRDNFTNIYAPNVVAYAATCNAAPGAGIGSRPPDPNPTCGAPGWPCG